MAKPMGDAFQQSYSEFQRMKNGQMRHIKTTHGMMTIKKLDKKGPADLFPQKPKVPSRIVKGSKGL